MSTLIRITDKHAYQVVATEAAENLGGGFHIRIGQIAGDASTPATFAIGAYPLIGKDPLWLSMPRPTADEVKKDWNEGFAVSLTGGDLNAQIIWGMLGEKTAEIVGGGLYVSIPNLTTDGFLIAAGSWKWAFVTNGNMPRGRVYCLAVNSTRHHEGTVASGNTYVISPDFGTWEELEEYARRFTWPAPNRAENPNTTDILIALIKSGRGSVIA